MYSVHDNQFMMATAYPSGTHEFTHALQCGSCYSIFSFICMLCRSLFVLLNFFFWPLCCLFFFDIRILIASLVSSNSYFHFRVIEALRRNDVTQRTIFEWKIFSRIFSRFSFEAIVQFYQEKHVIFIEILFVLEQLAQSEF